MLVGRKRLDGEGVYLGAHRIAERFVYHAVTLHQRMVFKNRGYDPESEVITAPLQIRGFDVALWNRFSYSLFYLARFHRSAS